MVKSVDFWLFCTALTIYFTFSWFLCSDRAPGSRDNQTREKEKRNWTSLRRVYQESFIILRFQLRCCPKFGTGSTVHVFHWRPLRCTSCDFWFPSSFVHSRTNKFSLQGTFFLRNRILLNIDSRKTWTAIQLRWVSGSFDGRRPMIISALEGLWRTPKKNCELTSLLVSAAPDKINKRMLIVCKDSKTLAWPSSFLSGLELLWFIWLSLEMVRLPYSRPSNPALIPPQNFWWGVVPRKNSRYLSKLFLRLECYGEQPALSNISRTYRIHWRISQWKSGFTHWL